MHDVMNQELFEGDIVLIPAKITKLHGAEDYCNVSLESKFGRRPDGAKETIHAINTAVLIKVS